MCLLAFVEDRVTFCCTEAFLVFLHAIQQPPGSHELLVRAPLVLLSWMWTDPMHCRLHEGPTSICCLSSTYILKNAVDGRIHQ